MLFLYIGCKRKWWKSLQDSPLFQYEHGVPNPDDDGIVLATEAEPRKVTVIRAGPLGLPF